MKTAMGMDKAKVWISGNLGTKIATRLFRGVALGALLVAATGLYFSINQGDAGSTLASEHTEANPEINTAGQHNASFPLSAAEIEGWPEYTLAGLYGPISPDVQLNLARIHTGLDELTSGGPASVDTLSSIDLNEVWTEIEDTPIHHLMKQLKAGTPSSFDPNEVWPEIEDTPVYHLMKQLKAGS